MKQKLSLTFMTLLHDMQEILEVCLIFFVAIHCFFFPTDTIKRALSIFYHNWLTIPDIIKAKLYLINPLPGMEALGRVPHFKAQLCPCSDCPRSHQITAVQICYNRYAILSTAKRRISINLSPFFCMTIKYVLLRLVALCHYI